MDNIKIFYISGPISGLDKEEVLHNFKKAELYLKSLGHVVINPCTYSEYSEDKKWIDYMTDLIPVLIKSNAIYLLKDWEKSKGAVIEKTIADSLNLEVRYEAWYNKCIRYTGGW